MIKPRGFWRIGLSPILQKNTLSQRPPCLPAGRCASNEASLRRAEWVVKRILFSVRFEYMKRENLLRRIELNPKIMLGKAVIKGTRLPVDIIVEKMAYGASVEDVKQDYPFLKENDIRAALLYAAKRLALEETHAA
jgi:uncharacterized protein (DUF433 family)